MSLCFLFLQFMLHEESTTLANATLAMACRLACCNKATLANDAVMATLHIYIYIYIIYIYIYDKISIIMYI